MIAVKSYTSTDQAAREESGQFTESLANSGDEALVTASVSLPIITINTEHKEHPSIFVD